MIQSLRYGFRSLSEAPLMSSVTILTLAIGIGLNAGIFTVVNGMMFRARIEKDPDSFVQLVSKYSGTYEQPGESRAFTTMDFEAFRTRSQSLTDIAAWRDVHLHFGNEAESTLALVVTCEFFNLYGLSQPLKGRRFSADECSAHDSPPVMLVSEALWKRRLSGDPDIVGKSAYLEGVPLHRGVQCAHDRGADGDAGTGASRVAAVSLAVPASGLMVSGRPAIRAKRLSCRRRFDPRRLES